MSKKREKTETANSEPRDTGDPKTEVRAKLVVGGAYLTGHSCNGEGEPLLCGVRVVPILHLLLPMFQVFQVV